MRIERDSLGSIELPSEALHGIHTRRARDNFAVSGRGVQAALIRALVQVKKACALAHGEGGRCRRISSGRSSRRVTRRWRAGTRTLFSPTPCREEREPRPT